MKRIISGLMFLLVPMVFGADNYIEPGNRISQTWGKTYGTSGDEEGWAVCQCTDGGYAITGQWDSLCILRVDSLGNTLWRKSYGGCMGYSIQQTSDKGFIVVGDTGTFSTDKDIYLVKTDSLGNTVWKRRLGGTNLEQGYCVQQTTDMGYIITGYTYSAGAGRKDVYLIKTDSLGDTLWSKTWGNTNYDKGYSVRQTSDGGYIVTGTYQNPGSSRDCLYLIKTDGSGGTLWTKIYGSTSATGGFCVQQTTDGGYIIIGAKEPNKNVWLVKTDASGDTLWTKTYEGGWFVFSCWLSGQQTTDGGYIIGTKKYMGATWDDFLLYKTDSLGNILWSKTYGGVGTDIGFGVQQTTDKGYIFVGYTEAFGVGGKDVMLIKTDSLGGSMEPDISTDPSELVFNYNYKSPEYGDLHCPSVVEVSYPLVVPALAERIKEASNNELIPILITMSEQLNMDFLFRYACKLGKNERRQWVISQAQALAQRTQQGLLSHLKTEQKNGKASKICPLWIVNSISAKVTKDVIFELSLMPGIGQILLDDNCVHILGKPAEMAKEEFLRDIVWGVDKIRADSVWINLGYTGKGIIIGHGDTGVNYNHTDLADHMWNGGATYPNHGWDFINDDNDPMDDNGHGTHTAGTIAGDGTSGTQTGVAPDVQIMAIKIADASGSGSLSNMASCVQFSIYHGADIISMSMGVENPSDYTKNWCRQMCAYAFAADLPMAVSAGNGAGGGSHYQVPHETNSSDVIANFSSYGPTEWWDYSYPPGLIKPDVSAPGVNVVSLMYNSSNGYTSGWNGTSMACPHLAGTIALMLEKNPLLTSVEIDSIIENFGVVDLGVAGKDNYYGAGRIDAYNAVLAVSESGGRKGTFRIALENSEICNALQVSDITWNASWIKRVKPTELAINIDEFEVVSVYVDSTGLPSGTYWDTLWIYSNDPDENPYPEPVCLITTLVGIEETEKTTQLPMANALCHLSPNPFKSATRIHYTLAKESNVNLVVYNVLGQHIKTFVNNKQRQGYHEITWDTKDDSGNRVPAGVYFVQLTSDEFNQTEKVILLK